MMDRMRQDASETSLQDSLKKALDMLEKIKAGWVDKSQIHIHVQLVELYNVDCQAFWK